MVGQGSSREIWQFHAQRMRLILSCQGGVGALLAGDEGGDPLGTSTLATSVTSQTQEDVSVFAAQEEMPEFALHCNPGVSSSYRKRHFSFSAGADPRNPLDKGY